ncbi:DNA-3-methyladenine glycosylase [Anaerocolumna xylanovorans]|uniref:Putative 3-methyladenine DNA glycosylase n=1 Tax=Anaerocolumna xylanovorans DSM 12503 TaxID=1121345 RepID=A0A1M7YJ85_9FIRM|nr:DNA-3-methyladenine glycosylase [Anaerocolumna xylanovorans]SHO52651.1 DNA-3-methyladenine glycosylase [Anaerocolumna xylanovorans DSM 12503]
MAINMKLPREFYRQDGVALAKALLGKVLVHNTEQGIVKGIIVETESYMGVIDAAAHSYKGKKDGRCNIQYNEGGYAYIYMIYGMYYCMNIVANAEGVPEVVLLRALEPAEGIPLMEKRRSNAKRKALLSGPGKLCQAMGIGKENYGIDLCGDQLYVEEPEEKADFEIEASRRINIDYAGEAKDYLWRFTIKDSPYVSVKVKKPC